MGLLFRSLLLVRALPWLNPFAPTPRIYYWAYSKLACRISFHWISTRCFPIPSFVESDSRALALIRLRPRKRITECIYCFTYTLGVQAVISWPIIHTPKRGLTGMELVAHGMIGARTEKRLASIANLNTLCSSHTICCWCRLCFSTFRHRGCKPAGSSRSRQEAIQRRWITCYLLLRS